MKTMLNFCIIIELILETTIQMAFQFKNEATEQLYKNSLSSERRFRIQEREKPPTKKLLCSVNLISSPHYYPDYGLDINNMDPFGNKFNDQFFVPGGLSEIGEQQTKQLAKIIVDMYRNYAGSDANLSKEEVLVIGMRLKRSIEAAQLLNEEILKQTDSKPKRNYVKKLDINYFNSSLSSLGYVPEKTKMGPLQFMIQKLDPRNGTYNLDANDAFTFFIPTEYENTIFPFNFQLRQCPKLNNLYELNLNSDNALAATQFYFKDLIAQYKKLLPGRIFERIRTNKVVNFLNFSDYNLNNNFEAIKILSDYFLNFEAFSESPHSRMEINPNITQAVPNKHLLFGKYDLFDFKAYDLFFIMNFSDDFIKAYMNGFAKYLMQLIYSKVALDANVDTLNAKTKLVNFVLHDFNLAGIYKALINWNVLSAKDGEMMDLKKIPRINYGSIIGINMIQDLTKLSAQNDQDTILNSVMIQITFNQKEMITMKLAELAEKLNKVIITDDSFLENLC